MNIILLDQHIFKGEVEVQETLFSGCPLLEKPLDLSAMDRKAMRYLAHNPDSRHAYQSRFNLYLLQCPPFAPQAFETDIVRKARLNGVHIDPIAIGDTESRNDVAFNQMREITGSTSWQAVEDIIHCRLVSSLRWGTGHAGDGMCWCKPYCMATHINVECAMEWTTSKLLLSETDRFRLTGDESHRRLARQIFEGLRRAASWDGKRAFYPGGMSPFTAQKIYKECCQGIYPHIIPPLVSYAQG